MGRLPDHMIHVCGRQDGKQKDCILTVVDKNGAAWKAERLHSLSLAFIIQASSSITLERTADPCLTHITAYMMVQLSMTHVYDT